MRMHASCLRLLLPVLLLLAFSPLSAQSYREQAIEAARRGDTEAAIKNYELALNSALKILKEDDVEITMRRLELGEAYRAAGRWDEAITQLDYVWKRSRYDAEQRKRWQYEEGTAAFGAAEKLGRALQGAGRYAEAAVIFATAISDGERSQRDADDILEFDGLLLDTLLLLNRVEEAQKVARRALGRIVKKYEDNPDTQVRMISTLARLFLHHKFYKEGVPVAAIAADIADRLLPPDSTMTGFAVANLGAMLLHQGGREDEAIKCLKDAEQIFLNKGNRSARELMEVNLRLSEAEALRGKKELAEQRGLEALRLARLHYPPESLEAAACLANLAGCYVDMKQPGKAADLYAKALEIYESNLGRDHPQTVEIRELTDLARKAVEATK